MPQLADTDIEAPRSSSERGSPLSDRELQGQIQRMLEDASSFADSELGPFRAKATSYYKGEKVGVLAPQPGRSSVVLTEVRDSVLQQLPSLMRVFFGPDGVVEFRPTSEKDIEVAEQQTDYANYIISEDNDGFLLFYTGFKDALVRRRCVIKAWWEEKVEIESQRLTGLAEEDLLSLAIAEPDTDFEEPQDDGDGRFNITYRTRKKRGRLRLALIAPEDFLYNRAAQNTGEAVLLADRSWRTKGELLAMGYSEEDLRDALTHEARNTTSAETAARRNVAVSGDPAHSGENALIRYAEAYVWLVRKRGDPPELRKVCTVGEGYRVVNNEPVAFHPYALGIPDPEPHEMEGLGTADSTIDLQDINSFIARGVLDSLNLALTPRTGFVEGQVNLGDLMNTQVGALIRMRSPNALQPVEHRFLGDAGLATLETFRGIKEDRLGMSRASVGLNNDALQSATKSAVDATVGMRDHRMELLARVFAETLLKQLFRIIYRILKQHQNWERVVRLRGKYTAVDPRLWASEPDVTVTVGIGGGTRTERMGTLTAIIEKQEAVMQILGPNNPLVDLRMYRNALAEMIVLSGRKDPEKFWKPITGEELQAFQQQQEQQSPQPDPALVLAEAQIEVDKQKLQADTADREAKNQMALARQADEMELQKSELEQKMDLERDKLYADIALRGREIELRYRAPVDVAAIRADMERQRVEADTDLRVAEAALAIPDTLPESAGGSNLELFPEEVNGQPDNPSF